MTKNSHAYEYSAFLKTEPSMRYDGKEPFADWQARARKKLSELLGLPLASGKCEAAMEYKREQKTHIEYRFTVETEPGYAVPCHLLVPKGAETPIPLTVCLSGHGGGMHVALGQPKCEVDERALASWPHRAMAKRAISEGRAALVIEARNFGESSLEGYGTSCTEAAKIAILCGRTVIGERVHDVSRALDAVDKAFPEIDMKNIVATGNSGGGTATYYLACMDERITAAMPSCSICDFESSIAAMPHCLCNHIPSIRRYFEMGDLGGLIAPRVLIIATGKEDEIFPLEGAKKTFEKIRTLYKAAEAEDRCVLCVGEKGHLNYADLLWEKLRAFQI